MTILDPQGHTWTVATEGVGSVCLKREGAIYFATRRELAAWANPTGPQVSAFDSPPIPTWQAGLVKRGSAWVKEAA